MTYHPPERVQVRRIGSASIGDIETGIYVAQIRDHFHDSYRLIAPTVDSYDSAFDMAVNNEGSPMASRDGFAIFNKN